MSTNKTEPLLLTPGPLTTSAATKQAMLRDWGARHGDFIELTARVRHGLLRIVGGEADHVAVPIQGSGTFAVEATIGTLVPADGKLLVPANGTYGRRMAQIARRLGRAHRVLETPEDVPLDANTVAGALADDGAITHVAVVHSETGAGMLNPLGEIAAAVSAAGRRLIVDAMSSFGAIPIDASALAFDAMVAAANKCLEGVPGMACVIARRDALDAGAGNAPSLSLDLTDQWRYMEKTGEWRFTPPTHVVAALAQALEELEAEGGVAGRGARYGRNRATLVAGMRALGFETYLPDGLQAPVNVAFRMPGDAKFEFTSFYDAMAARRIVIYSGGLSGVSSFRMGCIGRIEPRDLERAVTAVRDCLGEMGVESGAPAPTDRPGNP